MNNPFDSYDSFDLSDLQKMLDGSGSASSGGFGSLAALSSLSQPASNALTGSIADLLRSSPPPPAGNALTGTIADLFRSPPSPATKALFGAVNRKVYFAFDFDDLMRVNNVRQVGKVGPREQKGPWSFSDRSIWERRDIKNEENLKNLMRQAVRFSSVVCVLTGTKTWQSRWVKYEIARSVVDERGLLAIHLNGINHHQHKTPDQRGASPLHFMGVYTAPNGNFFLYEKHVIVTDQARSQLGFEWHPYADFTDPVPLPRYMTMPAVGTVMPLAVYTREYDMVVHDGYANMGAWFDAAAVAVGR